MGQEILYCFKCRERIVSADFAKGQAYQVGNHASCSACVSEFLPTLAPQDRERILARMFQATQERQKSPAAPASSSSRRLSTAAIPIVHPRPAEGNPMGWIVGISVAVVGVIVVTILASGGSEPPSKSAPQVSRPPVRAEEDPREGSARTAIRSARQYAKDNPRDMQGQIRAWEQAVTAAEKTAQYDEARRELGDLMLRRKESVTRELAELDETARPMLAGEGFKGALDLYQAARKRHDLPEWTQAIDRKAQEIRESAGRLYAPAKEKALAAQQRGTTAEVDAFRERIRKWGLQELIADLDTIPKPVERPWTSLIGPNCIREMNKGWKLDNGSLVKDPKSMQAAQSDQKFEDGEFRIRFEARNGDQIRFFVRQGDDPRSFFYVTLKKMEIPDLFEGSHEVILVMSGQTLSATLDGKSIPAGQGNARSGHLQWNITIGAEMRLTALDFRPLR
jgi:hypothetical protein